MGRETGPLFQRVNHSGNDVLAKESFPVDLEARGGLDTVIRGDGNSASREPAFCFVAAVVDAFACGNLFGDDDARACTLEVCKGEF